MRGHFPVVLFGNGLDRVIGALFEHLGFFLKDGCFGHMVHLAFSVKRTRRNQKRFPVLVVLIWCPYVAIRVLT
jgi:hypothetical protein